MKTKIALTLAFMLVMSAFLIPFSVSADYPPSNYGDHSTNYPLHPLLPPAWTTPPSGSAITPPGTGTVIDNHVEDGEGDSVLEFFTFQTPAGNVFFLVIDRSRGTDNVYFLNAVTEWDLMSLAEQAEIEQQPIVPPPLPPSEDDNGNDGGEATSPPPTRPSSNNGSLIFVGIAVVVFGGAGYYVKIVRPKKLGANDEEDEYAGNENDYDDFDDEEEDTHGMD